MAHAEITLDVLFTYFLFCEFRVFVIGAAARTILSRRRKLPREMTKRVYRSLTNLRVSENSGENSAGNASLIYSTRSNFRERRLRVV